MSEGFRSEYLESGRSAMKLPCRDREQVRYCRIIFVTFFTF